MNKKIALLFLFPIFLEVSYAQSPCGSIYPSEMTTWLNDYIEHPEKHPNPSGERTLTYIPIKFHLVGTSAGTGYFPPQNLWQILCELNEKYAPVGFYFYVFGQLEY